MAELAPNSANIVRLGVRLLCCDDAFLAWESFGGGARDFAALAESSAAVPMNVGEKRETQRLFKEDSRSKLLLETETKLVANRRVSVFAITAGRKRKSL